MRTRVFPLMRLRMSAAMSVEMSVEMSAETRVCLVKFEPSQRLDLGFSKSWLTRASVERN